MFEIGLSNYNSKYGSAGLRDLNEYKTNINSDPDSFTSKQKNIKKKDNLVLQGILYTAGGILLLRNIKHIPQLFSLAKTGLVRAYNAIEIKPDKVKSFFSKLLKK